MHENAPFFVFYSDVKKRINAQQKIRKRAITKI